MKQFKDKVIIGIDHGYGNIKTANHVFRTGVLKSDGEPLFTKNLLVYDGKYYTIGEGHNGKGRRRSISASSRRKAAERETVSS